MLENKDRIINLLVDFIKIFWNGDYSITIKDAQRVYMIKNELEKLDFDLKEKLK